jgi:hypothetical protein
MFRTRIVWLLMVVMAGCEPSSSQFQRPAGPIEKTSAGEAGVTAAAVKQSENVIGSDPSPGAAPFEELIRLIQKDKPETPARIDPEAWYGIWELDRGSTRTRMRIERPLIRMVGIDKKTGTSWVMDGHYAVAPNGMMYGVMTALDQAAAQPERAQALLENDERVLRGERGEKKMMPFCCQIHADGPELTVADFRGTCFEKDRESLIHGRYQQTSMGRPSCAVPGPPLGTWMMDSNKSRLTMVIQPGRFEFRLFDRLSGRRVNVVGNYDVATEGIIFGVITSVEHGDLGKDMPGGSIFPLVICFHYGFRGSALVIDEVHSLGLDRKTEEGLIGEYRPPRGGL